MSIGLFTGLLLSGMLNNKKSGGWVDVWERGSIKGLLTAIKNKMKEIKEKKIAQNTIFERKLKYEKFSLLGDTPQKEILALN